MKYVVNSEPGILGAFTSGRRAHPHWVPVEFRGESQCRTMFKGSFLVPSRPETGRDLKVWVSLKVNLSIPGGIGGSGKPLREGPFLGVLRLGGVQPGAPTACCPCGKGTQGRDLAESPSPGQGSQAQLQGWRRAGGSEGWSPCPQELPVSCKFTGTAASPEPHGSALVCADRVRRTAE